MPIGIGCERVISRGMQSSTLAIGLQTGTQRVGTVLGGTGHRDRRTITVSSGRPDIGPSSRWRVPLLRRRRGGDVMRALRRSIAKPYVRQGLAVLDGFCHGLAHEGHEPFAIFRIRNASLGDLLSTA